MRKLDFTQEELSQYELKAAAFSSFHAKYHPHHKYYCLQTLPQYVRIKIKIQEPFILTQFGHRMRAG